MKGYELARADIERRGNGDDAATVGKKPSLFAALFRGGKSTEEDDEGASAPVKNEKPRRRAWPAVEIRRSGPDPALEAGRRDHPAGLGRRADRVGPQSQARGQAEAQPAAADNAEPKPQTPADIINSRGFWDDIPTATNQATPAQVAALRARQALAAATDPQPTASVTDTFNKAHGLCAGRLLAGRPRQRRRRHRADPARPARPARNAGAAATEINTVVAKGAQGQDTWSRPRPASPPPRATTSGCGW